MNANWGLGSVSGLPFNPQSQYGSTPQVIQLLQTVPQQLQYIQQLIQHAAYQLQYLSQHSLQQGFASPISPQGVGQPFQTFGTGFGPSFPTQHVM